MTTTTATADIAITTNGTGFTAEQIAAHCPAELADLGNRIAAHLDKAARCDERAKNHRLSAARLLAQAKDACDEGGFDAFRQRFCPKLRKTRAYELLAIATGKKTDGQVRAANAERNRQHRQKKKAAEFRHVTEKIEPEPKPEYVTDTADAVAVIAPAIDAEPEQLELPPTTMTPDNFMRQASITLDIWEMTLAQMAETDPAGARACVEKIAAQLHAKINRVTGERPNTSTAKIPLHAQIMLKDGLPAKFVRAFRDGPLSGPDEG